MSTSATKILFILKNRDIYGEYDGPSLPVESGATRLSSGLLNSASFVEQMLVQAGIFCKLVHVTDNNDIDREVFAYKPTHVIIEGLWVVPEKFDILHKLHPSVKWIIRLHSEIAFLAMEGIAMEWIIKYVKHPYVMVSCNSHRATRDLRDLLSSFHPDWNEHKLAEKVILLPNYYPTKEGSIRPKNENRSLPLNIGCFGAIRPLKNQLAQAFAAIRYARNENRTLHFHINGGRNEQGGERNFKNIAALFEESGNKLIRHSWMGHSEFLKVLREMDASMCVSFTETFCIVAADTVNERIPLVTSSEVFWSSPQCQASPNDIDAIEKALRRVLNPITRGVFININHRKLVEYDEESRRLWLDYFKK